MAKRARGSVRPGQRRPTDRRPATAKPAVQPVAAAPAPKPAGLSDAEVERAAQIEADLLAQERAADDARKRTRERGRASYDAGPSGTLAVRAQAEYAYVSRDLRDIARIALIELGILAILFVVIDVLDLVKIGA